MQHEVKFVVEYRDFAHIDEIIQQYEGRVKEADVLLKLMTLGIQLMTDFEIDLDDEGRLKEVSLKVLDIN